MKAVIVTTKHRGVFFGYAKPDTLNDKTITLEKARCAIRFGTTGGFLELAETGPTSLSKIGSTAPAIQVRDITSVVTVTDKAEAAWKAA